MASDAGRTDAGGAWPGEADGAWRGEADDAWLGGRRSDLMGWFRRRFKAFAPIGGAVANAETGPYAGAPRNPTLRVDDGAKSYATIRYTSDQIAYTTTTISRAECASCGEPLGEACEIEYVRDDGDERIPVGVVRTCRACASGAWQYRSGMPAVNRAREAARRNVV